MPPGRDPHVVDRRRIGIPAGDHDHFDFADAARVDQLLQFCVARVKAAIQADQHRLAEARQFLDQAVDVSHVDADWLLAKDRLAGPGRVSH
jgi:hypothetical protein